MFRVIENKEFLEIQSYLPVGQRILFLLAGFFPLLAPYELLIRPDWHSYRHLFFHLAAVISAGALAVSALLFWAAVAGLNFKVRFDKAAGILTWATGAPVVRWRAHRYPIQEIAHLRVETHDWSDGAPSYAFLTQMKDGRQFKSGASWSREEIEDIVQRATEFLGLPAQG
jgi:hypothetical protein